MSRKALGWLACLGTIVVLLLAWVLLGLFVFHLPNTADAQMLSGLVGGFIGLVGLAVRVTVDKED